MPILGTSVDPSSETYQTNRAALLELIAEHDEQVALAIAGGGERYQARHRARGKLLARERIELLVDRDSPFLEFSALAAWGTEFNVGAVSGTSHVTALAGNCSHANGSSSCSIPIRRSSSSHHSPRTAPSSTSARSSSRASAWCLESSA